MNKELSEFIGKLFSFIDSLKLYHWLVTGKGSYAAHISLDQAVDSLRDVLDRLVETSIAMVPINDIIIPQTEVPEDIVKHVEDLYTEVESYRKKFPESFSQAIIDDYQEAVQQLLYRLKRLN